MKVSKTRSGISQTLDLFIIIGAVIAVGSFTAYILLGLGGSATSTNPMQVVAYSVSQNGQSMSITIKNIGATPLSIDSNFVISVSYVSGGVTSSASTGCPVTGLSAYAGSTDTGTWTVTPVGAATCATAGTITALSYSGPATAVNLAPGKDLSFVVNNAFTGANFFVSDTSYTIAIHAVSQSISENVVSN